MGLAVFALLVAALGIADHYDIEWLRVAAMVVFPASAALVTQLLKTRRQRQMRSVVPGSVEAAVDQRSRAGAFLGLLFGILVVMVLAAFAPDVHPWVICLVLLVVALLSYWIRHTIGTRPLSGAGQD